MRLRAWIWLCCAALLLAATLACFVPEPPIETDLLALLPPTERNPLAEQAATRLGRLSGERAVFLVGLPLAIDARAAAGFLGERLQASQAFARVVTHIPTPDPATLLDLYTPYRMALMAPELRGETLTADFLMSRLTARLSSPFGATGALPLAGDPFSLFDSWLQSLPYNQYRLTPEDGWLTAHERNEKGEFTWVLVSGELAGSAFDPDMQTKLQTSLLSAEDAMRQRWPEVRALRAGAIFHATAARTSAEREMHVIGLGSLAGIVLLLLLVYRSPGPLALGLLSVGIGVCAAVLTTTWVFGRLHLMTLVFGASLIGEAIDYAIQYFSARLGAGQNWDARQGLKTVFPALTVALATSVVGYAALAFTPFPAMRQIAVFAISGLAAAWLTVLLVMPWWLARPQTWTPSKLLALPARWIDLWRARVSPSGFLIFAALALLLATPGWLKLSADDDIRQLIQSPPDLVSQEQALRRLTGMEAGSQFFLIEGANAEQVLQREEALATRLTPHGIRLQGASRFTPSCKQQAEDQQRLRTALPAARQVLDEAGFRTEAASEWVMQVAARGECLSVEAWLASPLSTPFRHLWLGQTAHGQDITQASLALPAGYRDAAVLAEASRGLPGVTLVDKPGAVSRLFAEYRRLGIYVLSAATLLIFSVLAWRYGSRGAAAVLAPVLLAQALSLGVLGHLGIVLNLFNLLALLLVLGVGINYAIFLFEGARGESQRESAVLVGVALSAATTLLSFGLLGLSSMPALHGFGVTLALGVGIAVLLAPAVLVLTGKRA